ncbi:hypothetical protein [Aporhodopirellula aestuarii]|uniref:Uncharacterized protein n=1 Tax=Aporhodopirellula aestuarii TaxID=2950107 RepID=A0ABT0UC29_9BACT|nr:hypothetical protein [Aporhodopirellula aestuarii]MCM2374577.1 hypothetical protein [Aporhodopirellula aestuarii]
MSQLVVMGESVLARTLSVLLRQRMGDDAVQDAANLKQASKHLWRAGDSATLCDTTHLLYVATKTPLTENLVFRTHCQLRPSETRSTSLSNSDTVWCGAIVFVSAIRCDVHKLANTGPFAKLKVGNYVLPFPLSFIELMATMKRCEPLLGESWKNQLMAIEGLAAMKKCLNQVAGSASHETSAACESLRVAIDNVLDDRLLNRLLEHREVIGELRAISKSISDARNPLDPSDLVARVRKALAKYL